MKSNPSRFTRCMRAHGKEKRIRFPDFRELADELIPYVLTAGFTHIELGTVSEHPLFDSWGYQPVGLYAPSSRYGSPDDFRILWIMSPGGLGVILDWVPAHFPSDDHGLARLDGSSLYEHPDLCRGWHPDWQTCIYDFGAMGSGLSDQ